MKEEIKEILKLYKNDDIEYYNLVSDLGYDKLLDYITDLQEENKRLKENNYLLIDYQDMEIRYNEYKQRNEKAIDFMNNTFSISNVKDMFNIMNELENILKGDKDE